MYPVHWIERVDDNINYGFSIASPLWFQEMGNIKGFLLRTDDDLSEPDAFSVCTDIYNMTEVGDYDIKMVIRHGAIEVLADFHKLSDDAPCNLGEEVQYEAIFNVIENRDDTSSEDCKQYIYRYNYKFGYSYHVCMTYYGNKFHFYVGSEEIVAYVVEDTQRLSGWYEVAGFSIIPIDLSADNGQYICVKGNGAYVQHFRYYDRKVSALQRLEDCSWPIIHYLFDGLEADENGNCVIEHDVIGSFPYDLAVVGNPMVVSNIGNHLRNNSIVIPEGCTINIFPPGYNQCFVNFWVRFEPDVKNGTLYKHGSHIGIDYRYTDTGYLLDHLYLSMASEEEEGSTEEDVDEPVDIPNGDDEIYTDVDEPMNPPDSTDPDDREDITDPDYGDESFEGYFVKPSTWIMMSAYYQTNYNNEYTVEYFVDGKSLGSVPCTFLDSDVTEWFYSNPIKIFPFPGCISDFRVYLRRPTDEELVCWYNGDVLIDDRCTFCASKLTVDENIETFGFAKGEILAKGFDFLEEEDENSASFDPSDGILRIKDFKQV